MKTSIIFSGIVSFLLATLQPASAEIIAGPITNPANGHDYLLLAPGNWSAAEREAEDLGGTLAVINNAAEQNWVFARFGHDGAQERSLWIGLHRQMSGGPMVWVDGSRVDYVNWQSGQPDNAGGKESCAYMRADENFHGRWNDGVENNTICAVVEIPGKFNETKLAHREKVLIGNWYESGRPGRAAWIVGTHNKLFLITHDHHAARLIFTPDGYLYSADRQHGDVAKNKIVWSNGTWWSRQVPGYETNDLAGEEAEVLAGPIINPANNHEYFLLAPNTWTSSEHEAEILGGTLAVIRNADEQEWVFATFGNYGNTNRSLWIGRHRNWSGAPFTAVTDEKVAYYHWEEGQPDDAGGRESYVQMLLTGKWNDNTDTANPVCGVVEVPGNTAEKELTQSERSLIGDWYNNGDPDQPCCIAGTDKLLFAIAEPGRQSSP